VRSLSEGGAAVWLKGAKENYIRGVHLSGSSL